MSNQIEKYPSNSNDIDSETKFINSPIVVKGEALAMRGIGSVLNVELNHKDNLQAPKIHISKGGSIVLVANHESHADSAVLLWHVADKFKPYVKNIVVVAGSSLFPDYYDYVWDENERLENQQKFARQIAEHRKKASAKLHEGKVMEAIIRQHGYLMVKTIQADDMVPEDDPFYKAQATLGVIAHKKMNEYLAQEQTIIIYYPQGSRQSRDRLAPQGIAKLIKYQNDDHVMFLPIGLVGTSKVLTKHEGFRNLRSKISVNIGVAKYARHFRAEREKSEMKYQDLVMSLILNLIPQEQWGAYLHNEEFLNYQNNHFKEFGTLFDAEESSQR